jgi:hypothetical protein
LISFCHMPDRNSRHAEVVVTCVVWLEGAIAM